ncbi:hypothetical protein B0H17DRAFT_1263293 [Mycena rosella]|uniref:Uncharacterized protein n=1 Tax=Mycena rosella TaxID=1033263 RepID=A0AAD7CPX3_MYCRO|nr:hypothetical protein B0H17DRAFT_1263293 [Mycena rosella]
MACARGRPIKSTVVAVASTVDNPSDGDLLVRKISLSARTAGCSVSIEIVKSEQWMGIKEDLSVSISPFVKTSHLPVISLELCLLRHHLRVLVDWAIFCCRSPHIRPARRIAAFCFGAPICAVGGVGVGEAVDENVVLVLDGLATDMAAHVVGLVSGVKEVRGGELAGTGIELGDSGIGGVCVGVGIFGRWFRVVEVESHSLLVARRDGFRSANDLGLVDEVVDTGFDPAIVWHVEGDLIHEEGGDGSGGNVM